MSSLPPLPPPDWTALARLRDGFLAGTAGTRDYWTRESDLASYDATFAQRIGWKWDFVLEDLVDLGWTPPSGELIDWGCGSGIAARAFLDRFGTAAVQRARFVDRSPLAMGFAARRAAAKYPDLGIEQGPPAEIGADSTVLISHLLTELQPEQTDELLLRIERAAAIIWVEPGTYEASLALIAVRERLRTRFHPVAPCPHAGRCGILEPENESHWCHHFASPPSEVFTDSFWGQFANLVGIDLHSLPLSYLVLDRRTPAPGTSGGGHMRRIGHAKIQKADIRVLACSPEGAVGNVDFSRRQHPDLYRDARKHRLASRLPAP